MKLRQATRTIATLLLAALIGACAQLPAPAPAARQGAPADLSDTSLARLAAA
jgi:hypothetical protein